MSTTRREKNAQVVAERAARIMADTHFQRLRTRRARIALASSMIALVVVIPAAWILAGALAGILSVAAAAIVWWLLRMSVRLVADLPEDYLDERQSELRNRSYVVAYRWLGGVVLILASAGVLGFVLLGEDPDTWRIGLSYDTVMGIFWALEAAALGIPSIVLALGDRELPQ